MRIRILILCLGLTLVAYAQEQAVQRYAQLITQEDLKDYLSILASDALEGRATGTRGQKMAAAFIAAHFEELGLSAPVHGSYFQPVPLYSLAAPDVSLKANDMFFREGDDFVYIGSGDSGGPQQVTAVYAGNGSEADLKQVDVAGKAAVVRFDANTTLRNNPALANLRNAKASLIVVVMENADEYKTLLTNQTRMLWGSRMSLTKGTVSSTLGVFVISADAAAKMFKTPADKLAKASDDKTLTKIKPASLTYSVIHKFREVKTDNVLGFLEGADKKDEVIVITAHYDHIGKRSGGEGDQINNGADDDGSGTVSVMALAKAFAQAKKEGKGPRRSILFMTVTAEEVGLLGSQYYTDFSPVFPLEKTVVNLNIDMVGRRDEKHKDSAPYVYVIGSDKLSQELHTLSESTNARYSKLAFDYTYNDQNHPERLYYRSDHWNFAKKDIPIIFYFDGIHEDYHKPSDEVDKIEFDLLAQRARCVFYTAWEIANRENRIKADKK